MKRKHAKTLDAVFRTDGNIDMRKVEALIRELGGVIEIAGMACIRQS